MVFLCWFWAWTPQAGRPSARYSTYRNCGLSVSNAWPPISYLIHPQISWRFAGEKPWALSDRALVANILLCRTSVISNKRRGTKGPDVKACCNSLIVWSCPNSSRKPRMVRCRWETLISQVGRLSLSLFCRTTILHESLSWHSRYL